MDATRWRAVHRTKVYSPIYQPRCQGALREESGFIHPHAYAVLGRMSRGSGPLLSGDKGANI
jgi:hypothetical protein